MDKKYDVLIIGCGVAGLYTSLSLPENLSVLVLSKQDETVSNSSLAQGGVAAVLSLENDSYELHYNDTMIVRRSGQHTGRRKHTCSRRPRPGTSTDKIRR